MGLDVNVIQVEVTEVIDVSQVLPSTIEVAPSRTSVVEVLSTDTVIVESPKTTVIEVEVRIPGPPGPPGPAGDEEMKYSKRMDVVGDTAIFKGEATPGSAESDPVWRISRTSFVGDDLVEEWANGSASFVNTWTSRTSLTYI